MHIEPTVGRVVHIRTVTEQDQQPHAGIIVAVHGGNFIKVFDCNDICHREMRLVQDGDALPSIGRYAVWMPFQKGQAQKTEELERALRSAGGSPTGSDLTPQAFVGTLNEAVRGLTGPHVSKEDVNANIDGVEYFVAPDERTTFCQITLKNGYTIHGRASVVRKENFKAEIGQELAYQDAWKQIWALMAYNLAQNIYITNVLNNIGGQPHVKG